MQFKILRLLNLWRKRTVKTSFIMNHNHLDATWDGSLEYRELILMKVIRHTHDWSGIRSNYSRFLQKYEIFLQHCKQFQADKTSFNGPLFFKWQKWVQNRPKLEQVIQNWREEIGMIGAEEAQQQLKVEWEEENLIVFYDIWREACLHKAGYFPAGVKHLLKQ